MTNPDEAKKLSQARFSHYAGRYVSSSSHAKGTDLERLIALASPKPDWSILDVATGGGHTALKFAPWVRQVVVSDLTEKMLAAAREYIQEQHKINHFCFSLADAEALPFLSNTFDLVTCRIAPHHFPEPARFLSEAARVVRIGGLVLIQDHLLPDDPTASLSVDEFERRRDPSHVRAFSRPEWLALFDSAGLTVQTTEELVKRHDLIPWAERQGSTEETIADLQAMLANMPSQAQEWLQPENWGTTHASFVNHHLIIAGYKNS